MSWDIHISDLPEVASVSDIADDFKPKNLGSRAALIAKIVDVFPDADFTDPSWGIIDGDGWSIEVNIGNSADCDGIMLHVRGGDGAVKAVSAIVGRLGLRAIDLQTGEFYQPGDATRSFEAWRSFRDDALASYDEPKSPLKLPGLFGRLFSRKS
jgi:hypothetical protein